MARTKNNQRSADRVAVDVGATGTRPASKGSVLILAVSALAALWALAMMTTPGRVGYYYFFIYAEFYMGVITLVSLSITIMVGLVATDRLVLSIRQRVLLQSAHRTTGVMAVSALFLHVWTKVAEHNIGLIDAFIPFLVPGNRLFVGLGTLSGWIMMLVMWTGLARARFIGRGRPWMWRAIHAVAYLMWPIAVVHGLSAGRAASTWVVVSYVVCILLVLVGLAVRLSVSLNRRKDFSSTSTSGLKPVGKLVPTVSPIAKKRSARSVPDRKEADLLAPVAVVDTWVPAPVTAPPAPRDDEYRPAPARAPRYAEEDVPAPRQRRPMPPERSEEPVPANSRRAAEPELEQDVPPRRRRRAEEEFDYEEPTPRSRRYADDTSTRLHRTDLENTSSRLRRPDLENTSARLRRAELEETRSFRPDFDEPAPQPRRYADDDEPAPRSRRRASEPGYDEVPRGSRHNDRGDRAEAPRRTTRYADDEPAARRSPRYESRYDRDAEDAPRARRDRGADINRADPGRHSRSDFVEFGDPVDDANYLPPDETPTLVDMASRRARRVATQQDVVRGQTGRGARRTNRVRLDEDVVDDAYWAQLRGEAN